SDDCLGEASKLNNAGTFNILANGRSLFDCGGTASLFTNQAGATLNRNGVPTQAAFISVPFNNAGTANVGPGDLWPGPNSSGGSDSGAYNIADESEVVLANFFRKFTATATI